MKKLVATLLSASLVTSVIYAKGPSSAKGKNFTQMKQNKIMRLERKKETIEKRLSCIKSAQNRSEVKMCEKKYPLSKRNKKMMKQMKQMKNNQN
jgi:hypothetical protein